MSDMFKGVFSIFTRTKSLIGSRTDRKTIAARKYKKEMKVQFRYVYFFGPFIAI